MVTGRTHPDFLHGDKFIDANYKLYPGFQLNNSLISLFFPDYQPGSRTGSLLTRRRMILPLVLFILILAIIFIHYNALLMVDSYNQAEKSDLNSSLHLLDNTIRTESDFLGKTTQDYAKWDETAWFAETRNPQYIQQNLPVRSLKNLGITYVGISDKNGKTVYLKQFDPNTYDEIQPEFMPNELSQQGNEWDDSWSSLVCVNGTLMLFYQSGISNSNQTLSHVGVLIFGTPFGSVLEKRVHELGYVGYTTRIVSPATPMSAIPCFNPFTGITAAPGAQNETWKSGTIWFSDSFSSSVLEITVSGEKQLFAQGRSFAAVLFWRSVLFCVVTVTILILIIILLFRRHDKARFLLGAQGEELAVLKERREILDKIHQVLDQYLYAGLESDQNIPLILKTAGSMLKAEVAFYTRFEDGEYSVISSWPDTESKVKNCLVDYYFTKPESPACSVIDHVVSVDDLPEEGRSVLEIAYPRARMITSSEIRISGNQVSVLSLLISGDEPINEMNQIILDLIVHALSGEENRRRSKFALKRRDALLEAIGYSAAQVIGELSVSSVIEILHKIVVKLGVSEAHVFAWKTGTEGDPSITHDYVWIEETADFSTDLLNWAELLESPFRSRFFDMHGVVAGSVEDFPPEAAFLRDHDIHSIALIPFISRRKTWGVLILADRIKRRSWHASELDALRIASDLLMAALVRIDTEEEHTRRQENFQQFFDHLNDFVFILDSGGRIITANLFAQQETGIRASDMRGMVLSGLFTSRWIDEPLSPDGGGMSGQERTAVLLTIEGREIPVEMRYLSGIWNEEQAIFCICKDISHLKRSEQKFATAFRSSQVLHAIWNLRDDRLIDANKTFFEITGYSGKELRSVQPIGHGIIDPDQFRKIKEVILTEGSIRDLELPLKTKSGEVRQGSLYGALIEIDENPCVLFSIVDITDRKRAEQKVKDLLKEISASNKGLHDFAHIVAHDLKDPLRGIFSLATWIDEDYHEQIGSDGQRYVRMITEQVQRMYQLIDGILAYSQAGFVREELVPVSIGCVIDEVLQILAPPPSVHIVIETEMPILIAERTKIQQVFQNLIGNSLAHLVREDAEIRIRAIPAVDKDGTTSDQDTGESSRNEIPEFWIFEIADNGPGIDPSLKDSIFEIFRSYSSPGTEKSTGIGLSIVKRIVETSGGSIWVTSVPGEGAIFSFTIRVVKDSSYEVDLHVGGTDDTDSLY
jgi:PAS domain S-box-containing protein